VQPGRNLVVQQFTRAGVTVVRGADDEMRFQRALVSDLRRAVVRYPEDPSVTAFLDHLRSVSETSAALWAEATIVEHRSDPKTFVPPLVGNPTVDCDVFTVAGTDLRIVTYTTVPGSEDASRFDLLRTLGAGQDPRWREPSSPCARRRTSSAVRPSRTPRAPTGPTRDTGSRPRPAEGLTLGLQSSSSVARDRSLSLSAA